MLSLVKERSEICFGATRIGDDWIWNQKKQRFSRILYSYNCSKMIIYSIWFDSFREKTSNNILIKDLILIKD